MVEPSGWKNTLAVTSLCTVLLGSVSNVGWAAHVLVAQQTTVRTPQTVEGHLDQNSNQLDDGSYYATHAFEGMAGEVLTIELTSENFDTYLTLVGPDEATIAENDDGAGGTNSQIVVTLPITGTYNLIASSFEAGQTGQYQLEWRTATAQEQDLALANQLNQQVTDFYGSGRYSEAIPLAVHVLTITEAQLGPDHPDTATSLNNLAELYRLLGRYEEAEPLYQRALAIREAQLGPNHPNTATSLNNLALLHVLMGRYSEAEPLLQRVLTITEAQLGPDHPNTATSLNNLAELYRLLGRYEEAEPLYQRALAIEEAQLGPDHPNTAASLNNLALLYVLLSRYSEAEPLLQRALAIHEAQLGPDHPNTALRLNNLAELYRLLSRYSEAEPLLQRALAIHEAQLGPDHPDTATSLNNLALLYVSLGRYSEAEPLLQRALAIHEVQLGPDHPDTATSLNNLAGLYDLLGRYSEAEPLLQRALAIQEAQLGPDHSETATSLNNLAGLYDSLGRYSEAEPLYQRALAIQEAQLGPDHPNTAQSLNNLALLYRSLGRYEEAEPLYQRALAIREAQLGPDHPDTGQSLNGLAGLYDLMGRYGEAEPLFQRTLAIAEAELGPDHPNTALSLNNLALLYRSLGRYGEAEPLFQRALAIQEAELGPDHPDTALSLNNLAELYDSLGRYSEAEPLFQRALAIREAELGPDHPDTAVSLNNLAALYWAQGQLEPAFNYLQRGLAVEETVLSRNLVVGSDANKRDYLATVFGTTDGAISFHLNDLPISGEAAHLALTTILQRKGRILDLFTNLRAQLADDPEAVTLFDDLRATNTQLSTLTSSPPPDLSSEAYQAQLKSLQDQITTLEGQLSRRSSEFAGLTASLTVEDIQATLPEGTALVEFIRYQPFIHTASVSERFGPTRYVAYVLAADGTIQGVDLGPAEVIDAAVRTFSTSLASPDTALFQVKEDARVLDDLVMAPVRVALGDTTTVFISPDGILSLVPFEALVDEADQYLVETYRFRYLTSGRDLMRIADAAANDNPVVLIGNPTYGRAGALVAQADTRAIDFKNSIFPALPGTQAEVDLIAPLLSNPLVYTQTNATEAVIKQQAEPSILHIATHGFFEPTDDASNPLLQSGLILAGAADGGQSGPNQDGILTALEVTGLDLRGTQLVVLSACQTGLGALSTGEGLYGLRRAFVLAGAQSQVISLWKVSDDATQKLMVAYYQTLLAGTPRAEALRATQLAFLQEPAYAHPYYWAAFIGSGDWRPLQP
ncbi:MULTISPECIES: tetratricopeptide repeat protein [Cyanophyceae]|uniref:Tetratricopeptide repeat protein n=1 Tax=Leptolyngbya subtilissima DQ-A4 TaxID=2933933 RepID=A0ABV0KAP2_9CYAN|nr:tetratricopeptide repeat protein [Nodosilinea sp. FACHB-141]MBD2115168.1 tetratricopeptide repeat protein [Nodosilinea sp. FACHB-141]